MFLKELSRMNWISSGMLWNMLSSVVSGRLVCGSRVWSRLKMIFSRVLISIVMVVMVRVV